MNSTGIKVLFVPTWYFDFGEKNIFTGIFHLEQAQELQKYCNISVWFPFDKSIKTSFQKTTEHGLTTYRSNWNYPSYYINAINFRHALKRIFREFKPDIIHAQVAQNAGYNIHHLVPEIRIPVVITEHMPIEMMQLEKKKKHTILNKAFRRSKANFCVSPNLTSQMKKEFPDITFKCIPNGIRDPYSLNLSKEQFAKENSINCSITAGFYDEHVKGFQYLIPAINELIQEGNSIVLHCIGDGKFRRTYEKMAQKLHIEDNIIFYGHCDHIKTYSIMNQMDFCVSASMFESAGASIQEALLLGKPCVVTNSGGCSSLVSKDNALIVEKGKTETLRYGIEQMIKHLDTYDTGVIRKNALHDFEISSVTKRYIDEYMQVLS